MKRIECVLLMLAMTSLGAAAQPPKSSTEKESTPEARQNAASPEAPTQDRRQTTVASAAENKPDEAAGVSTSVSASFSPLPAEAAPASIPTANLELQSQIQEALSKDPALSKCGVVVTASAEGIDLTGNAGSSRERLAAWRMAESYARGRKVENHIVVNGKQGPAAPARSDNPAPASNASPSAGSSPGLQNNEFR